MKVMTALSGGVDSSVAACLLAQNGASLSGATLRLTEHYDSAPARKVAEALSIPFFEFDEQEAFRQTVIQNFADAYLNGETPNPCVLCNKFIKFGLLLAHAKQNGYDFIATGHYAKIEKDAASGRFLLKRAKDIKKDQTYMLYGLSQEQLAHTMFPLGDFTKPEIRALAESFGLENAGQKDSQDICFVPDGDYVGFLERELGIKATPGEFTDASGKLLGMHQGLIRYTVGQRKGLGITFGKPTFVIKKDAESNRIVLGDEESLFTRKVFARDVNLIACDKVADGMYVTAKTRYSQKEAEAKLFATETGVLAEFTEPQRAPSPGQAMVFYDADVVIGGGTIL